MVFFVGFFVGFFRSFGGDFFFVDFFVGFFFGFSVCLFVEGVLLSVVEFEFEIGVFFF